MKLSVIPLFALFLAIPAVIALPDPIAAARAVADAPQPTIWSSSAAQSRDLAKRDNKAVVQVDKLNYRPCPRTTAECAPKGQYEKDSCLTLQCYTRDNTTPIDGDYGWGKVASNGYWVALAWGKYVSWEGALPYC